MKQNSLISDFNSKEMLKEIDSISKLLLIKYPNKFDVKSSFKMANILYNNGIRVYMFFEEKYDIDEIVFFLKNRENVIKFVDRIDKHSFYSEDSIDNCDGRLINIDKYIKFNNRKKGSRK